MENDKNRNYGQNDRNYKEGASPEDYERADLQNEQNQDAENSNKQPEEFSTEQPNRYDNESGINSPETDDEDRSTAQDREGNLEPNYDEIRRNPFKRDRNL